MTPLFLLFFYLLTFVNGYSPISGNEQKDAKIVGGRPVPSDQFAWELSIGLTKNEAGKTAEERQAQPPLYKEASHHCDGVLISNEWVLTAAHCCVDPQTHQPFEPSDLLVGFQSKDLDQVYDHGRAGVAAIIIKEGHVHGVATSRNDIALLQLSQRLYHATYACLPLPSSQKVQYQSPLTSVGFGNVHALYYNLDGSQIVGGIQPSRYLKEIDVQDNTEATTNHLARYCKDRPDLICISAIQDQDSTCQGDSGGSLIYHGDLVIGITSFGDTQGYDATRQITCIGNTAYTRLAFYTDWIRPFVPGVCLK